MGGRGNCEQDQERPCSLVAGQVVVEDNLIAINYWAKGRTVCAVVDSHGKRMDGGLLERSYNQIAIFEYRTEMLKQCKGWLLYL